MTMPTKVDEVARRLAATTGQPYTDWHPAVIAWWGAGHDLDRLQEWAAGGQPISPPVVIDAIAMEHTHGTLAVPARPAKTDPIPEIAGRALVLIVSLATAATAAIAVAWRIVRWAFG